MQSRSALHRLVTMLPALVFAPVLLVAATACGGDSYLNADPLAPIPTEVDEDEILPPSLTAVWQAASVDEAQEVRIPRFKPAVGSTHVYLAYAEHLEARRAGDGSLSWQVELVAIAAPAIEADELVVATYGAIWWLSLEDGSFLGQLRISQVPTVLAAAANAVVFTDGAALYQVDKNGQGWVVEIPGATSLVTNASGDTAFVSTDNGVLLAINTASGNERWRYTSDVEARLSRATIGADIIYVAGNDQFLTALDANSGSRKWRRLLGVDVAGAPAVVGKLVYVAPFDSMLHAYDAKNGTQLYGLALSSRTYVDLVGREPWVVIGPRYGPWVQVRAPLVVTARGSLYRETAATGSDLRISPGIGPAGVALVNGDGTVILLRPQEPR